MNNLNRKTLLLVGDMLVNFGDILAEIAKAVYSGMWVGIPMQHSCSVKVSFCPSG